MPRSGLKAGILDADIYGPSQPKLFGLRGKPRQLGPRMLEPMERFGVKVMSIGFLVEEDLAMIWRGPMVISAITQMLREVAWGDLDILVVDLPPGTGDAQLTMAQQAPLAGAVIVSTPQDIALIDARRGIAMFEKVNIPILGLIENMSSFCCPACNHVTPIFGHGGARQEAERRGIPFLGEIPLDIQIRETSDDGRPIVATEPDGVHARHYIEIAREIWTAIVTGAAKPAAAAHRHRVTPCVDGNSRAHKDRIDPLCTADKTERSQFVAVQVDHKDRQDQRERCDNVDEEWRARIIGRIALRSRPRPGAPERSQ